MTCAPPRDPRRGLRRSDGTVRGIDGRNEPRRSSGIPSSISSARVAGSRGRVPLRSVVRSSGRGWRSAPVSSMLRPRWSSCSTSRTESRISSTPSQARKASRTSMALCQSAVSDPFLVEHSETHADEPHLGVDPAATSNHLVPGRRLVGRPFMQAFESDPVDRGDVGVWQPWTSATPGCIGRRREAAPPSWGSSTCAGRVRTRPVGGAPAGGFSGGRVPPSVARNAVGVSGGTPRSRGCPRRSTSVMVAPPISARSRRALSLSLSLSTVTLDPVSLVTRMWPALVPSTCIVRELDDRGPRWERRPWKYPDGSDALVLRGSSSRSSTPGVAGASWFDRGAGRI